MHKLSAESQHFLNVFATGTNSKQLCGSLQDKLNAINTHTHTHTHTRTYILYVTIILSSITKARISHDMIIPQDKQQPTMTTKTNYLRKSNPPPTPTPK